MNHKAACCCGQLTLTYQGDLPKSSICHCFACQQRTGSVFGAQARFSRERVQIAGESTKYIRKGDEGTLITYHFCPKCGSTVFWEYDGAPESYIVAVGAFANPDFPSPTFSVYEARQHRWVNLPETVVDHMD